MPSHEVKKGQQYYRVDGSPTVWQVRGVFGDPSAIRHAQLFNVERPYEVKTLSCSILLDSNYYRLLTDDPRKGAAVSTFRRP
jgi:hypothetical protein